MSKLSDWWKKWYGEGTPDDRRNPFWRLTEFLAVEVEWARYIFDLRIGFKRGGRWQVPYLRFWQPVTQNFWNGIFTLNIYVIKTTLWRVPVIIPRVGMVIRYSRNRYFQFGVGILFDRGEFGFKLNLATRILPGEPIGWEEGSV